MHTYIGTRLHLMTATETRSRVETQPPSVLRGVSKGALRATFIGISWLKDVCIVLSSHQFTGLASLLQILRRSSVRILPEGYRNGSKLLSLQSARWWPSALLAYSEAVRPQELISANHHLLLTSPNWPRGPIRRNLVAEALFTASVCISSCLMSQKFVQKFVQTRTPSSRIHFI